MNYTEWSSLKIGDRVKRIFNRPKGTIISTAGIGYVVKYDDGTLSKTKESSKQQKG